MQPHTRGIRAYYSEKLYREYVQKMKIRYELDPRYGEALDPTVFVARCLRMEGRDAIKAQTAPWFKAHLTVASAVLTASGKTFISPIIINDGILNLHGDIRFRVGAVGRRASSAPASKVQKLLMAWQAIVQEGIRTHANADDLERWVFTTKMFDLFFCLMPFPEGNRRTNWYQLQSMRLCVGLPPIMPTDSSEEAEEEADDRLDVGRWIYFVPWMKEELKKIEDAENESGGN